MAMTYGARVNAARTQSEYTDQITAALASHARWVQETEQPLQSKQLAYRVARAPLDYTQSMALMVLMLPTNAALASTDDLTDQDVQDSVGEAWAAFVEPAG